MLKLPAAQMFVLLALCTALSLLSACGEDTPHQADPTGEADAVNPTDPDAANPTDPDAANPTDPDAVTPDDTATDPDAVEPQACAPRPTPLRRLSHFEYENTVRDLFPDLSLPDLSLPPDNRPHEFDNDASGTIASAALVERYIALGREVAAVAAPSLSGLITCVPADDSPAESARCGQQLLETFGARAFRRPLTPDEVQAYSALFTAEIEGATFQDRLQLTVQALLSAPEFLYRFEQPTTAAGPGDAAPLDAFSVASRLSYFLWATMPDSALYAAAQDGSLLNRDVFLEHAERMVNDPRALHNFTHFHTQWLDVDRIDRITKSSEDNLDDALRASMKAQVTRFVEQVLYTDRGSLQDLLTSERVFVDASLAPLYGVDAPADGWAEVAVPGRVGILTQPSFLASHGHPDKPSPVLRGAFVLDRLMCVSLGAPPPNAEAQAKAVAETIEGPLTNRAFYELVTSESPCSSCHALINPVGAAFEQFDTMGRFQTVDPNGLTIDTAAAYKDLSFTDAPDFAQKLSQDPSVDACMVRKWVRYAYAGGPLERASCLTDALQADYIARGGSIRDLQFAIVAHPFFSTFSVPEDSAP
jgi:hypothetical protein